MSILDNEGHDPQGPGNTPRPTEVTKRIEAVMEKYAPSGYDPASDDCTIPFAVQLVDKDETINRLLTALRRIDQLAEKNVPKYAQQIAREALINQQSGDQK